MAKKKNKTKIWLIAGAIVLVVLLLWIGLGYNGLVDKDKTVDEKWANVESNYQRRIDFITNLVSTVEGAVKIEKETQTKIAEVRTGITDAKAKWDAATTPEERAAVMPQIDTAANNFRGLNINVENYPQLKATENFLSLQDQLEGTENRINTARIDYNKAIRDYNTAVYRIPTNIIASTFGFDKKESFGAEEGAEKAPKVAF